MGAVIGFSRPSNCAQARVRLIRLCGNALLPIVPLLADTAVPWDRALLAGTGSERENIMNLDRCTVPVPIRMQCNCISAGSRGSLSQLSNGAAGGSHPPSTRSTVHSAASLSDSCFDNLRFVGFAPGPLELNSAK